MISDVLSEAVDDIDTYLRECPDVYADILPEVLSVRGAMESLREKLDAPPLVEVSRV